MFENAASSQLPGPCVEPASKFAHDCEHPQEVVVVDQWPNVGRKLAMCAEWKECDDATSCSGQGSCAEDGTCVCGLGWSGIDCSISLRSPAWSDEFEGSTLDASHWHAYSGCRGGGNGEAQCYTRQPDNVFVQDGRLVLQAVRDNYGGSAIGCDDPEPATCTAGGSFRSGRVDALASGAIQWGRMEVRRPQISCSMVTHRHIARHYCFFHVSSGCSMRARALSPRQVRARVPSEKFAWPAAWLAPLHQVYGYWPASGEIDVLEVRGGPQTTNMEFGTIHYGPSWREHYWKEGTFHGMDLSTDFHTYAVEWTRYAIEWFVDGTKFHHQRTEGCVTATAALEPWAGRRRMHVSRSCASRSSRAPPLLLRVTPPLHMLSPVRPASRSFRARRSQASPSISRSSRCSTSPSRATSSPTFDPKPSTLTASPHPGRAAVPICPSTTCASTPSPTVRQPPRPLRLPPVAQPT